MIDRLQISPEEINNQAEEIKARALELADEVRARLAQGNAIVSSFVEQKPLQALGLALGLGVALGWLIKRR